MASLKDFAYEMRGHEVACHDEMQARDAGATRVLDVRLNNVSQLSGFAKRDDLEFFLKELCGIDYRHDRDLAPTQDILDDYEKNGESWSEYERKFLSLMKGRRIERNFQPERWENACLLCSEDEPHRCHRRLVAEYLQERRPDIEIQHLPTASG